MVRILGYILILGVSVVELKTYSQSLFSSRAMGIGAYAPLVNDTRSFTENPAGIVHIRDWDLSIGTYIPAIRGSQGFVFQGVGLGKKILDDLAVAIQYSQGSAMEFGLPIAFSLEAVPVSVGKRINYDEPFAAAIGYRLSNRVSVGLSGRITRQKITDVQYQYDTLSLRFRQLPDNVSEVNVTSIDVGVQWKPFDVLSLSVVRRGLARFENGSFPDDLESYKLSNRRFLDLGASVRLRTNITMSAQYSTAQTGSLGVEWLSGNDFALRTGVYMNNDGSPFVSAVGAGVGWGYKFFSVDIAYLKFTSQKDRQGTSLVEQFDPSSITSIDLNRYTSDRVQFSLKVVFGNVRTSLVTIGGVEILEGVYPSAYEAFATRPIGRVRVKNISDQPIDVRARFYVEKYMDSPTESQPVYMLPGEEKELPLTAIFNEKVKGVEQMMVREGNVYVSATPAEEYDDKYAARVVIHGKHDWDGSVYSLRYFVTPEDPSILRYTRDVLLQHKDSLGNVSAGLEDFQKARVLFNAFAGKLVYVSDPKQSADYVQYPSETLQLQGGDCDDMTTCFSSLLNSVGISTAFVDVVPPEDSSKSHVYLLFDTGLDPRFGNSISPNAKRYITRKNQKGIETIWIPIETTVMTRGFEAAWSQGAQEYFDDVEIGLGLIKGWVKIVDVY